MVRRIPLFAAALVAATLTGCNENKVNGGGLSIEIDGPVSPAHTNGLLTFQIDVSGHPERVELRRDGALLTQLNYPYLWAWDTTTVNEGSYSIVAVAIDGEDMAESAPVQVNVDRTAPQIVQQSPLPGAEQVDVHGTITVVLDEAIDYRTIDAAQVSFAAGNPINGATLSADYKTITMPVASDFFPVPNVGSVNLNGVRDLAGNPIAGGNFNYEVPAWLSLGSADRIPASDAGEPAIAVDSNDDPVVAFLEDAGTSLDLVVSRWDGDSWEALGGALDSVAANEVGSPTIVVDSTNAPIVAWIEWDGSTGGTQRVLRAARWSGSAWVALGAALNETAGDASAPALIPDSGSSVPMLAWNEGGRVRASRWVTSSWVATGVIPNGSARGAYLSLGNGTVRLVHRAANAEIDVLVMQGDFSWVPQGSPVSASGRDDVSITFDEYYFVPVVAAMEEVAPADFRLVVRQFDGASGWYDVSFAPPTISPNAANPKLTNAPIGSGGVFFPEDGAGEEVPPPVENYPSFQVAWEENGDVKAAVFDFFEWMPFGTADLQPTSAASHPSINHDGAYGVYLAWDEDESGARSVRIGRMNKK